LSRRDREASKTLAIAREVVKLAAPNVKLKHTKDHGSSVNAVAPDYLRDSALPYTGTLTNPDLALAATTATMGLTVGIIGYPFCWAAQPSIGRWREEKKPKAAYSKGKKNAHSPLRGDD